MLFQLRFETIILTIAKNKPTKLLLGMPFPKNNQALQALSQNRSF